MTRANKTHNAGFSLLKNFLGADKHLRPREVIGYFPCYMLAKTGAYENNKTKQKARKQTNKQQKYNLVVGVTFQLYVCVIVTSVRACACL